MTIFPHELAEVHEFYLDKEELVSRIREGDFSPHLLEWALQRERKWKKEQLALYRTSMQEHVEAVKEYLRKEQVSGEPSTGPSPRKNGVQSSDTARSSVASSNDERIGTPPPTTVNPNARGRKEIKKTLPAVTVQDISLFYESQGLVGEEATRELLLYAALGKVHVGIESLSGGGKTFLLDTFLEALPKDCYEKIQQISEKALFNDATNYREAEVEGRTIYRKEMGYLVATEYQKVMNNHFIEEVFKNIAEGKPSTYTRTNKSRDGTDKFELIAKCLIYTFAINNEQAKNKRQDAEVARRFLILHTDISTGHIDQVAQERSRQNFKSPAEFNSDYFKEHISQCLSRDEVVVNPFLPYIEEILPSRLQANIKRMSFMPYLGKLIGGCTTFHYAERPTERQTGKNNLFSTLYDTVHTLSLDQSLIENNIQGLSVVERQILDTMETEREYSTDEIFTFLPTFGGKPAVVEEALTYLQEELRQLRLTRPGCYVKEKEERMMFDVERAYESAQAYMEGHYPAVAEQWKEVCRKELEELL